MAFSFAGQITRFALQFGSTVILARLLTPENFGLIAMASPVLALVGMLSNLGLSQATIQRPTISQDQLSFMFWTNLGVSAALTAVLLLCAPLAAAFFGQPALTAVISVLAVTVLLGGLGVQHGALLNRQLKFGALAAIDVGAALCGAVAGVLAALAGWSFWAIVVIQITISLVSLIGVWVASGWVPSRPRRIDDANLLLGFGANMTTFAFFEFFTRNLDNILIGRFLGPAQVGLYDRAYKLLLLPLNQVTGPITKVATPLLSRTAGEPQLYGLAFRRLLETMLLVTYPGCVVAAVTSQMLVTVVLGDQWKAAATVFQILAIGTFFAPISNGTGWLLTTQDRTGELRNMGIVSSIAFAASFVVGLPWGIVGVAACYITVGTLQGPIIWYLTTKKGPVTFTDLLAAVKPFAIAALSTALVTWLLMPILPSGLIALVVLFIVGHVIFALTLMALPSGRRALKEAVSEIARLVSRKSDESSAQP